MDRATKLLITLFLLFSTTLSAVVWNDNKSWDSSWEDEYSTWVETSYNEDIFLHGKYKGIATDCADAVYTARIIFAYENGLNFAIKDPSGGKNLITNRMSRYNKSGNEFTRVRNFINFINDITSTKTLPHDTFPVKITRQWVRPGGAYSRPRANARRIFFGFSTDTEPGHAELIKEVSNTGVVYLIGSTVPKTVRKLKTTSSFLFKPKNHDTGIRYWLKPNQYGKPIKSIPGFSLEQFKLEKSSHSSHSDRNTDNDKYTRSLNEWNKEIQNRLKLENEDKEEMKYRYAQNFCALLEERIDVIKRSEKYRKKIGRCMNEQEYDLYSTPSRDGKLLKNLKKLVKLNTIFGFVTESSINKSSKYLDSCGPIEYLPGKNVSATEIAHRLREELISSDPNHDLAARWGEYKPGNSGCTKYY